MTSSAAIPLEFRSIPMSYKIILVHVDESKHLDKRVEVAAKIALHQNAHLVGVAVTGISRLLHRPIVPDPDGRNIEPYNAEYMEMLRQRANGALDKFETLVRGIGVTSYEKRLIDDEAADAISMQGLYADLIVLGQSDPDDPSPAARVDFPEYVVLNSECPVLIVPYTGRVFSIGDRVLIAWNESTAASRAVRNAMPFLQQAKNVQVAIINAGSRVNPHCEEFGAEIVVYLARHNIKVEVIRRTVADATGHALLALAADLTSDLIVMGGVAHPRSRSVLLGGATGVVLEEATVPVLMSH
jgi:nucleotide-binding universal stress UspA family protein